MTGASSYRGRVWGSVRAGGLGGHAIVEFEGGEEGTWFGASDRIAQTQVSNLQAEVEINNQNAAASGKERGRWIEKWVHVNKLN